MSNYMRRGGAGRPVVVARGDGNRFDFGGFGVHWKLDGAIMERRFAIVHHRLAPRALTVPLHYHHLLPPLRRDIPITVSGEVRLEGV